MAALPCFEHPPSLLQGLIVLGDKLYAKALSAAADIQVTVQLNGLAPDIAWYAQEFENRLRKDTSSGIFSVRACFDLLRDLEVPLAVCRCGRYADDSLVYIVVQNQMHEMLHSCRDLLVVRAQILCPAGDRASFEAVLDAGYGE